MQNNKIPIPSAPGVEIIPAAYDFGIAEAGYEPMEPVCFIVRNTGDQPLLDLHISIDAGDAEKFWLSLAHTEDCLAADGETAFFAYPVDALGSGTHTAAIHIAAREMAPVDVALRFTVGPGT